MKRKLIFIIQKRCKPTSVLGKRKRDTITENNKRGKNMTVLGKRKRDNYDSEPVKKPYIEDLYYFYWMLF
jgi:hypothetical protein|tara:strand:+ start:719 stop:928 length:210 start_codon:yes stop_codon:yes gene_type:complete